VESGDAKKPHRPDDALPIFLTHFSVYNDASKNDRFDQQGSMKPDKNEDS
jgi:hypothetical protein